MKEIDKSKGKTIGEEGKDEHAEKSILKEQLKRMQGPYLLPNYLKGMNRFLKVVQIASLRWQKKNNPTDIVLKLKNLSIEHTLQASAKYSRF